MSFIRGRALARARDYGLGTTIVANYGISKSTVGNYCTQVGDTVCCKFLGGGAGVCPTGSGIVDPEYQTVTLEITKPGYARLIAGPPKTVLSEDFKLPGVSAPRPPKPPKEAPPSPGAPPVTTLPEGYPPPDYGQPPAFDLASLLNQYSGTIGFAAAALILGLALTRNKRSPEAKTS